MIKLPDIFAIRQQTDGAFKKEVQNVYELLMQRFAKEVTKAANMGYCGWSEKFTNCDDVFLSALNRCKKEIRKQGYRCHIERVYNPRTDKIDAIDFTISWRAYWFE